MDDIDMYFFETEMTHAQLEAAKKLQAQGKDWRGYRNSDNSSEENEGW